MTDTTDIKALRDAIRYCSIAREMYGPEFQGAKFKLMKVATPELLSSLLDQLEAERQRAEALQTERDEFRRRLKLERSILEDADKEIAKLKGEQVPVGWEVCSPEWCNKHNACHEAPRIWFESEDGTGPHYHPSEYIAPQKLTDLSYDVLFNAIAKSATPLGEHMSISVKDFKAAIEAAGGIVKDGE